MEEQQFRELMRSGSNKAWTIRQLFIEEYMDIICKENHLDQVKKCFEESDYFYNTGFIDFEKYIRIAFEHNHDDLFKYLVNIKKDDICKREGIRTKSKSLYMSREMLIDCLKLGQQNQQIASKYGTDLKFVEKILNVFKYDIPIDLPF